MVKKILSFVGREISGLHEAAYLLAGSAIASLFFALIRDRLLAHIFGASAMLDVYYAAFRVPDFIYVTVASLVSTSILVPFLVESKQKGEEELRASIRNIFSAFFFLIAFVSVIALIFMKPIQSILFPEIFSGNFGGDLVSASRILLLSPILLGIAGFFTSITQIQNRFLAYALSSPLYNIGIIIGILFLMPYFGLKGLVWGVVFGAGLLAISQIPLVVRDGLCPKISLKINWSKVKKVAMLSVPRTITLSSQQITNLALVSFAGLLGTGSISIFSLAINLQSVPLSIIGVSYSSAAFPVLAKLIAQKNKAEFLDKMISAVRHVIFWSIPITVLFVVLRAQIVRTVLGSGQFDWSDTRLTAAALALFVVSSVAQSLMLIFVRSFYAEGKTSKPLVLNIVSMIVTIISAIGFIKIYQLNPGFQYFIQALLKTDGAESSAVLMLPLAFTFGAFFNLWLHWRSFAKEFVGFTRSVFGTTARSVSASLIGGYTAFISLRVFDNVFDLNTLPGIFMQGFCAGIVGIITIVIVLILLKSKELFDIVETVRFKIWKVDRASLDRLQS